jgi:hypothetical protein
LAFDFVPRSLGSGLASKQGTILAATGDDGRHSSGFEAPIQKLTPREKSTVAWGRSLVRRLERRLEAVD